MSDDLYISEDEEDLELGLNGQCFQHKGTLSKWTNYIHGWQDRHIDLRDGTLSYYKSANDTAYGCRGAISIIKATVKPHEFDECRFDVSVNDCVWYLRAETPEERNRWVEALETYKMDSAYGSENSLRRHGSALSLGSTSLSGTSVSSLKKSRGLREKLAEMETFRDILCQQVETLQNYFDTCADAHSELHNLNDPDGDMDEDPLVEDSTRRVLLSVNNSNKGHIEEDLGRHAVDFKGEAFTFKATTAGILATLSHCIELMGQREDSWRRRLEKEIDRRKKVEDLYRQVLNESKPQPPIIVGGPDYEEGPHCMINEEEFFDAVDAALDKNEQQEEEKRLLKSRSTRDPCYILTPNNVRPQHLLWPDIDRITLEQLKYSRMGVGEGGWQLFAEEGEMKMYKRELEEDGMVVDPLKAVHTVRGITGHEMCHYFFSPEYRYDWESTMESMKVLEEIDPCTLLFHQIHKRVWPATQRDALFWSHIRQMPNDEDPDAHDIWIVCNHSAEHPDTPAGKCVRVKLTVCLVCQTFVDPPAEDQKIRRENLTCKITYSSTINPGGWAPASVLRAVYKREYPKFLKRFTQYVKDKTENKAILF